MDDDMQRLARVGRVLRGKEEPQQNDMSWWLGQSNEQIGALAVSAQEELTMSRRGATEVGDLAVAVADSVCRYVALRTLHEARCVGGTQCFGRQVARFGDYLDEVMSTLSDNLNRAVRKSLHGTAVAPTDMN